MLSDILAIIREDPRSLFSVLYAVANLLNVDVAILSKLKSGQSKNRISYYLHNQFNFDCARVV